MNHQDAKNTKIIFWIAGMFLIISMLACAGEQKMGKVNLNTPAPFTMYGETNHEWRLEVRTGKKYEITVEAENLYGTRIEVLGQQRAVLASMIAIGGELPILQFDSTFDGEVVIAVSSVLGDQGDTVGQYTLIVQEKS